MIDRLRRAGAHPLLEPAVALWLRAWTTRSPLRFVARELLRRPATARYTLRESGLTVLVRHRTGDVVTIGEIFHRPDYEPPEAVRAALPAAPRVLDLGGNIGLFGAFVLGRWPDARVTSYEPDRASAAVLRGCVAANALEDRWTVVQAAAAARDGEARFAGGNVALSRLDEEGDDVVRAEDVLERLRDVDWLKMDVEGGEWAILSDERFAAVAPPVAVLEYHPHLCPADDPHTAVDARLRAAGYDIEPVVRRGDGHGMLWAWKRR